MNYKLSEFRALLHLTWEIWKKIFDLEKALNVCCSHYAGGSWKRNYHRRRKSFNSN